MAGSVEDWKDRSISTTFQQNAAVADPVFVKSFQSFDLASPHPGYGKDDNIINEYGHTKYPKLLYPNGREMPGVVAENANQEREIMGEAVPQTVHGLRQDGPTIEQFVNAGFKATDYPPKGYEAKTSKEEIEAFIAKQNAPQSW